MVLHSRVAWKSDYSFASTYVVRQTCKVDQKWTLERKTNGELERILLGCPPMKSAVYLGNRRELGQV